MSEEKNVMSKASFDELIEHFEFVERLTLYGRNSIKYHIKQLQQENKRLREQLEYFGSGEYLNQLKFERNMLEDIVNNGEISKEDKEFIDMTHRNTELLEENQQLKEELKIKSDGFDSAIEDLCDTSEQLRQRDEVIEEALEIIEYRLKENNNHMNARMEMFHYNNLKEILTKYKGDNNENNRI